MKTTDSSPRDTQPAALAVESLAGVKPPLRQPPQFPASTPERLSRARSSFWLMESLLAVVVVLFTLGLRLLMGSRIEGPTLILFTVPIIISAYRGGLVPGLVATGTAFLSASYFLLAPIYSFRVDSTSERWQQVILIFVGLLISAICEGLRRARSRAEASEELFSKSFRLSPDCVAVVRLSDRTVIQANDALCRLWGGTSGEIIGKPAREYSTWVSTEAQLAFLQKLQDQGECLNCETTFRLADGRLLDFNVSSRTIGFGGESCVLSVMRDITEKKRTEVAAAHLAAIVESSADAIIGKDLTGVVMSWNAGAERIFGYAAAEMIGQPISRLIPKNRQHEEAEILERVRQGESVRHFDTVRLRKDGGPIDISVTVSAVKDPTGKIVGASKVARDITRRKQAEAALRASEGRYRALFEYAPDGIVIANSQSTYLDANASICRMLGYTRDELIGLHASNIVVAAEVENIAPALSTLKAEAEYHREWQFRRKDDTSFTAEVIATALPDGNLLGMIRDVTERKQAEKVIRESAEYFRFLNDLVEATRTLADPAQIMAVMARMLGVHLAASRCAYADVEEDGEHFTILHDYTDGCASTVGKYQLSRFGARAAATLRGGETLIIRSVEAELTPDEGGEMFNAIGIKAIITCPLVKAGALHALMAVHQTTPRDWKPSEIGIVQDVIERCWATIERRNVEEKIRHLNAELEQRVNERTAQLEAANKELEAFSYSVSHDLRAPLRSVDGFSQLVMENFGPTLPAEAQRLLQVIRDSSQRMGELIDDLLAFARLGRQPLSKRTVNTEELVRATLAEMSALCEARQIEVRIGGLPSCEGDAALLKQVWVNLLSNALKYTNKREHAVVEVGCVKTNGADTFFVRDNGSGFDMRYAGKLFGVFQRLHRAEDYEGTGVGLAIVQRIVSRHGGRVWADAAVDRGATFYFTLEKETKP